MPLTYLGQLRPTMQQQIALQKALATILKEDDAMRRRAEEVPTLSQRLGGTAPAPYAGPTPTLPSEGDGGKFTGTYAKGHFRPGAGSLEEALRAAEPATGKAKDIQAEAWAKRTEMVEAEQAKLDKEADALYSAVQDLSPKDQDFILSKVVGKGKSSLESALSVAMSPEERALMYEELHEQDPTWDPTEPIGPQRVAIKGRTDPLMQTMIDKNYIRLDETGKHSWMLPMKEKAVKAVHTWTDESGWLQQTTTYEDGTVETETLGRAAKEEVTTGLTSSEQLGWARLQFDVDKAGAIHVSAAIKERGEAPIEGVTMVKRPGGKDRKATADDVAAYWQAIKSDADYRRVAAEGIKTKEDLRIKYQYDIEAIKNFQRNIPGMVVDGKWSDTLEQEISNLLLEGE